MTTPTPTTAAPDPVREALDTMRLSHEAYMSVVDALDRIWLEAHNSSEPVPQFVSDAIKHGREVIERHNAPGRIRFEKAFDLLEAAAQITSASRSKRTPAMTQTDAHDVLERFSVFELDDGWGVSDGSTKPPRTVALEMSQDDARFLARAMQEAVAQGGEAWTETRLREFAKQKNWYVREGTSVPDIYNGGWKHPFSVTANSGDLIELLNARPAPEVKDAPCPREASWFERDIANASARYDESRRTAPSTLAAAQPTTPAPAASDELVERLRGYANGEDKGSWRKELLTEAANTLSAQSSRIVGLTECWGVCRNELRAAEARATAAEAERDALREALAPFAAVADEYDDSEDDSHEVWTDRGFAKPITLSFSLSNYRKARAALLPSAKGGREDVG